jgi:PadR family transcriptional regulator PadR
MDRPTDRHWGYNLSKESGVRSGVLYPILHRMLEEGWLEDDGRLDSVSEKRPARRYYELTADGRRELDLLLGAARSEARFARLADVAHRPGGVWICSGRCASRYCFGVPPG